MSMQDVIGLSLSTATQRGVKGERTFEGLAVQKIKIWSLFNSVSKQLLTVILFQY